MRFGSVEFFKVLIKTVLAIFFFVPLVLAVVFGVMYVNNKAKLAETEKENTRLSAVANVLVEEKIGDIDDFREIFEKSGVSYEEFLREINKDKKIDAEGLYTALNNAGISDKDIIAMAASKKSISGAEFHDILSKNGISDKDLLAAAAQKQGGGIEGYCKVLESCGIGRTEILSYYNSQSDTSSTTSENPTSTASESSPVESSPYAGLHEDMYVPAPSEYKRETGTIYLTFDDGPSEYTYSILNYLDEFGIKATFFVVPNRTEECYTTLKEIVKRGHSIGIHTASHDYDKIYASVEAYLEDFHEAWSIVREATGVSTPIFRFPGGSKNDFNEQTRDDIIKEMTRRGFRYFDWNVESGDAAGATWTNMYNSIPRDVRNTERAFVLFHDTKYNTVLVLEDVLKVLKNEGYKFDKINADTRPVQFIGEFS